VESRRGEALTGNGAGTCEPFSETTPGQPPVRGFLHRPASGGRDGLVLTHGAGGNCSAPLLVGLAAALSRSGIVVLRCDLPFRQVRAAGPPSPAGAARDRDGLRRAVHAIRRIAPGRVFLGGASYGGRQASMLLAEEPGLAEALLLLSYPLHPPGRARELRTAHLPRLGAATLFVHGSTDPFGTLVELEAARALIPARTALLAIDGAGHGLGQGAAGPAPATIALIDATFRDFTGVAGRRAAVSPAGDGGGPRQHG
jgi:predicted alpha/beta-hydrolase family hydrolase